MIWRIGPVILLLLGLTGCQRPITRIAFGSCLRQDRPQPIWNPVLASQPDLFIFLGDNVYADTDDPAVMRKKYDALAVQPGYQALRQTCRVLAIWDDHDYGRNDAGSEFAFKPESQSIFLNFFGDPPDSPRRTRGGVYDAYTFGPPGRRVQVILLDTRYFRGPLVQRDPDERRRLRLGPYRPTGDASATLLGETQWAWLEDTLREPADLRIIASSIQVISGEHGWESWGNFPHERKRLFDLIATTQAHGVVFISGDRHLAELSRTDEGPYPLHDLTGSSLNAGGGGRPDEPNPHRLQPIYQAENFGTIDIDWRQHVVELSILDVQGRPAMQHRVSLKDLVPSTR